MKKEQNRTPTSRPTWYFISCTIYYASWSLENSCALNVLHIAKVYVQMWPERKEKTFIHQSKDANNWLPNITLTL